MNTIEAMFSFLIFLSLIPLVQQSNYSIDHSHYALKLGEDIWRILYLKGSLNDFDENKLNENLNELTELTSLCIEFKEKDVVSCIPKESLVVIKRIAYINGNPRIITISIGR